MNPLIMFKEGWCVELGQEGLHEGSGNCLKDLNRGRVEGKKGEAGETKI